MRKNLKALIGVGIASILLTGCSATGSAQAEKPPESKGLSLEESVQSLVDTAFTKIGGTDYRGMTLETLTSNGGKISEKFDYMVEVGDPEGSKGGFCIAANDGEENYVIYDSGIGRFAQPGESTFYCNGGTDEPTFEEQVEVANPKPHVDTEVLHPSYCWSGNPADAEKLDALRNSNQVVVTVNYEIQRLAGSPKTGTKQVPVSSCKNIISDSRYFTLDMSAFEKMEAGLSQKTINGIANFKESSGAEASTEFSTWKQNVSPSNNLLPFTYGSDNAADAEIHSIDLKFG